MGKNISVVHDVLDPSSIQVSMCIMPRQSLPQGALAQCALCSKQHSLHAGTLIQNSKTPHPKFAFADVFNTKKTFQHSHYLDTVALVITLPFPSRRSCFSELDIMIHSPAQHILTMTTSAVNTNI